MERVYKKITDKNLLKGLNEEHKETINKMLEIQDILLINPPNDKKFKNHEFNYMIDYINILNNVQFKDYSDEYLQNAINKLYDKIFKCRRY